MLDISGVLRRLPSVDAVSSAIDRLPAARQAASPFVAGDSVASAVAGVAEAMAAGMTASVLYLPTAQARGAARLVHMQVIEALSGQDLSEGNDLAVDLGDLGLGRGIDGDALQSELAALCSAAGAAGMTVTFMGLRHPHVGEALAVFSDLVDSFPDLGFTVAANLLRSEGDCIDLADWGARVRLIRREWAEPGHVAFTAAHDIDRAFVRCARVLIGGGARVVVSAHDPTLVEITSALVLRDEAGPDRHSHQFRRGLVGEQAAELAATGGAVAVLVPFGPDWPTYVAHHITPTLSTLGQAARAAAGRGHQ
jgi:proline dehydrogenase